MSETKYFCDLCKEERQRPDLYTVFYTPIGPAYRLVEYGSTEWNHAHKHICKPCVKMIIEAVTK